ncbi:MAG: hypothetical protein AAGF20_00210 [Pseudomonadota bacterium]
MRTFKDLISKWESVAQLAKDLGYPYERVSQWGKRDSIPPEYWPDIIAAAPKRGLTIDINALLKMRANTKNKNTAGAGDDDIKLHA